MMAVSFPFRNLEPYFLSGLLDDPLLLIKIRPTGSHLLFDCGQLHHLAKRVMTRIETVFVSHCHMDHLLGIDLLIRHLHAAGKQVELFGPPGFTDKLIHHFSGYDWNLAEDYWSSFRVHEVHPERIESGLLSGPEQFRYRALGVRNRDDLTIFSNRFLRVDALLCDHRVPSLVFRIDEQLAFLIDSNKLAQAGFAPGPWIRELKRRFFAGQLASAPLAVLLEDGKEKQVTNVAELCQQIGRHQEPATIGYISDIGFTEHNRQQLAPLFANLELLICETTFLAADEIKARNSFHLCTSDINQLLGQLKPRWFMPMHLSKTYSRRCDELYRELQPPPGTSILQLPKHTTPPPRLLQDFSWQRRTD